MQGRASDEQLDVPGATNLDFAQLASPDGWRKTHRALRRDITSDTNAAGRGSAVNHAAPRPKHIEPIIAALPPHYELHPAWRPAGLAAHADATRPVGGAAGPLWTRHPRAGHPQCIARRHRRRRFDWCAHRPFQELTHQPRRGPVFAPPARQWRSPGLAPALDNARNIFADFGELETRPSTARRPPFLGHDSRKPSA